MHDQTSNDFFALFRVDDVTAKKNSLKVLQSSPEMGRTESVSPFPLFFCKKESMLSLFTPFSNSSEARSSDNAFNGGGLLPS